MSDAKKFEHKIVLVRVDPKHIEADDAKAIQQVLDQYSEWRLVSVVWNERHLAGTPTRRLFFTREV